MKQPPIVPGLSGPGLAEAIRALSLPQRPPAADGRDFQPASRPPMTKAQRIALELSTGRRR